MRKAYGILAAVATRLGERMRDEPQLIDEIRATSDAAAFRALVRDKAAGRLPPAVLEAFVGEVVQDGDWLLWRSRLLIQAKMTRDGKERAPGHEHGRGVGRP